VPQLPQFAGSIETLEQTPLQDWFGAAQLPFCGDELSVASWEQDAASRRPPRIEAWANRDRQPLLKNGRRIVVS
jgi:hypothetical protein